MGKMLQVRNVPDDLHAELVRRAERRGQSLTAFVQEILEREVARPPARAVHERIASREPVELESSAAEMIREERGPLEES